MAITHKNDSDPNKIWCLFSVANNYDQPPHNLEAWWKSKPNLDQIASALGMKFPNESDEATIDIVKVWSGENRRINDTDYWLEQIGEGKLI